MQRCRPVSRMSLNVRHKRFVVGKVTQHLLESYLTAAAEEDYREVGGMILE